MCRDIDGDLSSGITTANPQAEMPVKGAGEALRGIMLSNFAE